MLQDLQCEHAGAEKQRERLLTCGMALSKAMELTYGTVGLWTSHFPNPTAKLA